MTTPETPPPLVPAGPDVLRYYDPRAAPDVRRAGVWLLVWMIVSISLGGLMLLQTVWLLAMAWSFGVRAADLQMVLYILAFRVGPALVLAFYAWQCYVCRKHVLGGEARYARRAEFLAWPGLVLTQVLTVLAAYAAVDACVSIGRSFRGGPWEEAAMALAFLGMGALPFLGMNVALPLSLRSYQRAAAALGLGQTPLTPLQAAARWLTWWAWLDVLGSGGVGLLLATNRDQDARVFQLQWLIAVVLALMLLLAAALAARTAWQLLFERITAQQVYWRIFVTGTTGWVLLLWGLCELCAPGLGELYARGLGRSSSGHTLVLTVVFLGLAALCFLWTLLKFSLALRQKHPT